MPVQNYSVLKGRPTSGKLVRGASTHYEITVQAGETSFTVAVNIQSTGGSEVLYDIEHAFAPPDPSALAALSPGMTSLLSEPGSLALDFVREEIDGGPMVTREALTLLPQARGTTGSKPDFSPGADLSGLRAAALTNAVTLLVQQAIADRSATLYAFGSAYKDSGRTEGIHNIHMNQGNPLAGGHARDNGVWQDGALFLQIPTLNPNPARSWVAVFLAFQSQSWSTDDQGNPLPA